MTSDRPLSTQQPSSPNTVVAFPLDRQVGKVKDVASKLLTKTTERHAASYRGQVTNALAHRLDRFGFPENVRNGQIAAFWRAVDLEVARLTHRGKRPGGGAAWQNSHRLSSTSSQNC